MSDVDGLKSASTRDKSWTPSFSESADKPSRPHGGPACRAGEKSFPFPRVHLELEEGVRNGVLLAQELQPRLQLQHGAIALQLVTKPADAKDAAKFSAHLAPHRPLCTLRLCNSEASGGLSPNCQSTVASLYLLRPPWARRDWLGVAIISIRQPQQVRYSRIRNRFCFFSNLSTRISVLRVTATTNAGRGGGKAALI